MFYTSTRDKSIKVTAAEAITNGISKEGGLYVPTEIPKMSQEEIKELVNLNYNERAKKVLKLYLTDFTEEEISNCVDNAYNTVKFSSEDIAPVVKINDKENILELWHGPTCAFKDMALQLLPHLLTVSVSKFAPDKQIVILVATSGDTGKAALEGFKNVKNTKILVFYPVDGVSPMQKLQMTTQDGDNVSVCAIKGNFDDAQTAVKNIFTDSTIIKKLEENNMQFSSANSINWGRLVPQIVYYFSAYCDLVKQNQLSFGDKVNFTVPTGNFGNILAAYYAKEMGLPINKLICASNSNNVLTDFINTGSYNKNRPFYTTTSPSMDILVSSNLERLLYHISDDETFVSSIMNDLNTKGEYTIPVDIKSKINNTFVGGCSSENAVFDTINNHFNNYDYLMDTHTAVAVNVYENNLNACDNLITVIDSTASPYKFSKDVLNAVTSSENSGDEFDIVEKLNQISKLDIPQPIKDLKNKSVRFTDVCEKENMSDALYKLLNI